jgi:hypothetical protein
MLAPQPADYVQAMSRAAMWTWCAVGFAVLVLATAVATIGLFDVNSDAYSDWVNYDPQGNEQQYEALRTSAAMVYTSGHAVGQLCAALFGVLLGVTAAARSTRWTLALAISGGAVLALVNLAIALPRARAATSELWMFGELTSHGFTFDHNLMHDWGVAAFLVSGLIAFPLWTILGLGTSLRWRPVLVAPAALVWFPVSIVGGFLFAGVASIFLPLYSNLGLALLTLEAPWATAVTVPVLVAWAVGLYRIGSAATRRKLEPATSSRSDPETT